jgi:Tfp pilus assembly protein PilF
MIKGIREDGLKNILLSEIYSCRSYFERLFHGTLELSDLSRNEGMQLLAQEMNISLADFFEKSIFKHAFKSDRVKALNVSETKEKVLSTLTLLETMLKLNLAQQKTVAETIEGLNLLYGLAHDLHELMAMETDLEVQFPRLGVLEMRVAENGEDFKESGFDQFEYSENGVVVEDNYELTNFENDDFEINEDNQGMIPHFYLDFDNVVDVSNTTRGPILSLENQRTKKFSQYQKEGHEALFAKDPKRALEKFTRALNYKDNAETLTLIAWCHSLTGNNQEAKNYCLRAIRKDPDYGPPYNDLGSILLTEGEVEEALKWFQLAKKALNYQNREYPYINSGRAYMAKKEMTRALEEFSIALTLAPFHEELHQTVEKLKRSLLNEEIKDDRPKHHENVFDI